MCGRRRSLFAWTETDPDFDMDAFRLRVAGVMNGGIVRPPIPAKDTANRPTLRRGAKGDAVKEKQAAIGVKPVDASYGPATEAAVRGYQRTHGLVPDGIWGPACWASLNLRDAA